MCGVCVVVLCVVGVDDFMLEKFMVKYDEILYKILLLLMAAAVFVVGLSLLCKTFTGYGLSGMVFGLIEGIFWFVFLFGVKLFWLKV